MVKMERKQEQRESLGLQRGFCPHLLLLTLRHDLKGMWLQNHPHHLWLWRRQTWEGWACLAPFNCVVL